jgi:dUTP pyrophosphatase
MSLESVYIKILRDGVSIPKRATDGSAGYDIEAEIDKPITLLCGERKLIPTGFAVHITDPNYAMKLLPRSGLGHKNGIVLGNLVGLVDSDYQGEVFVSLWNSGNEPFTINPYAVIAQMIFERVEHPEFIQVENFDVATKRGEGGFGSTTK